MTMALVLVRETSVVWSALSFYACLGLAIPMGLMWAPQPVRTDRRVRVAALVVVALAIGVPVFASTAYSCQYAWWAIECWFA